jgi:uncharacterized membrane protein YheB (UPF0754 family)
MEKTLKVIAVNLGCLVFGTLTLVLFFTSFSKSGLFMKLLWILLFLAILWIWIFGNYSLLLKKKAPVIYDGQLKTIDDYQRALNEFDEKCFKKQVRTAREQLDRLAEKNDLVDKQLKQYFGNSQISYAKFMNTVNQVNDVFLDNMQKMMNRISMFDYAGYKRVMEEHAEYTDRFEPYKEPIEYVNNKVEDNEKILNTLDELLLEISKLNDSPLAIEDMGAMRELDELISQTKLYKH